MGAETFTTLGRGNNVADAFVAAHTQAQYDYGHAGYTGTIAEKFEYHVISKDPLPPDDAFALAEKLIDKQDPRIDDKWGPAGAIRILTDNPSEETWLFFGWASS